MASGGAAGGGGLVSVVSAEQVFRPEPADPEREAGGDTGGRDDASDMAGFRQTERRQGVDGAFHQQRGCRAAPPDPESTERLAGSWSHAPEGPLRPMHPVSPLFRFSAWRALSGL